MRKGDARHVVVAALMLLAAMAPAVALGEQGADLSALDAYREGAIQLRYSSWTGVTPSRGADHLGFLASGYGELFSDSEEALATMETYRRLQVAGFVLWVVGGAGLLAELVVLIVDMVSETSILVGSEISPTFWGWLGAAGVVGVTGGFIMSSSRRMLFEAVEAFNDDLYRRLVGAAGPRVATLRLGGTF